jgi:hypothetical protein
MMHPLLLDEVIESVRRRVGQGDCPTEAPQSRETLENAVLDLDRNFHEARGEALALLASGMKKFAPDLVAKFADRWKANREKSDMALDAFLEFLRGHRPPAIDSTVERDT